VVLPIVPALAETGARDGNPASLTFVCSSAAVVVVVVFVSLSRKIGGQ
jgi:hypothetical protein